MAAVASRRSQSRKPGSTQALAITLAPLRVPYVADVLPLLPALAVFQFSLATPERLPGPLLLPLVALALGAGGVLAAHVAILPLARRPAEATFVATIALAGGRALERQRSPETDASSIY